MLDSTLFAKLGNGTGYDNTNVANILNPYVQFHSHENTQTLADTLVAESIQMRGVECYYLPREFVDLDLVFGEDPSSKFTKAWKFAAYLESFEGYEGANTFFSKYGMSVQDEINISINPGLFKHQTNGTEPKEGDLIYFKMDNSLFEIKWVEPYNPFYQVGRNAIRKINAAKFVYSGEEIQPDLQRNEGIYIDDHADLDLEPLKNLDGMFDILDKPFEEVKTINTEAKAYVEPYVVQNNRGEGQTSPFDDDF